MEEEKKEKGPDQTKPQNEIKGPEHKALAAETLVTTLIYEKLSVVTSL
jgi:hypothetical protein